MILHVLVLYPFVFHSSLAYDCFFGECFHDNDSDMAVNTSHKMDVDMLICSHMHARSFYNGINSDIGRHFLVSMM